MWHCAAGGGVRMEHLRGCSVSPAEAEMNTKTATAFAVTALSAARRAPSGGFAVRPNPGVVRVDHRRSRPAKKRPAVVAVKASADSATAN